MIIRKRQTRLTENSEKRSCSFNLPAVKLNQFTECDVLNLYNSCVHSPTDVSHRGSKLTRVMCVLRGWIVYSLQHWFPSFLACSPLKQINVCLWPFTTGFMCLSLWFWVSNIAERYFTEHKSKYALKNVQSKVSSCVEVKSQNEIFYSFMILQVILGVYLTTEGTFHLH